jgi:photosystem II stability/assembly factor-like uncharacterized protein
MRVGARQTLFAVLGLTAGVLHGAGASRPQINCVAVDPSSPSTVYAGHIEGGVFKSTDGGAHFAPAGAWEANESVRSLAVDPAHPRTLYAGNFWGQLKKSTDGGAHWAKLPLNVYRVAIQAIAIEPRNPLTLYVGTEGGSIAAGVQKSTDGGATWKRLVAGFPSGVRIYGLAIDPSETKRLLAAGFGDGIFLSIDGALHWKKAAGTHDGKLVRAVAAAPGSAIACVETGGIFRSTDGGETWGSMDDERARSLAFDPSNPKNAWAGSWNKILRSTDGGESWQTAMEAHRVHFTGIAVDPRSSSTVHASASHNGVWKTTDSGKSWSREPEEGSGNENEDE